MNLKSFLCYLLVISLLTSCGSGGLTERYKLRDLFKAKKYGEALKVLKDSDTYKSEDSKLLQFVERGIIYHNQGNYFHSNVMFSKAKELSRKLYTVRISKKIKSLIANDNYDVYYGDSYERSLIHFYKALNHLMLYQNGIYESYTPDGSKKPVAKKSLSSEEKKNELYSARAEILDWDSTISTLKNEKIGESVFKNDLMLKVFGGFIHESIGTRNDDQIAYQLYKDGIEILFRSYNAYKTFNGSSKKFKSNYKNFPTLKYKKIKKEYTVETNYYKSLYDYLVVKTLVLTRKIRPGEFKRLVKEYTPSKEILKRVKKIKRSNLMIVFKKSLISMKVPEKQYFGLNPTFIKSKGGKVAAAVGGVLLTHFAAKELGMVPPPRNWSTSQAVLGIHSTSIAVNHAAIQFELPKIESNKVSDKSVLIIKNSTTGKERSREIKLVNPLSDIAEEAVAEKSGYQYGKLGARLAIKYLGAIATAYTTYKVLKKSSGSIIAKSIALVGFAAATKGIAASESADTRFWSLLPSDMRVTDLYLQKGSYNLEIRVFNGGTLKSKHDLGAIKIDDTRAKKVVIFRSI